MVLIFLLCACGSIHLLHGLLTMVQVTAAVSVRIHLDCIIFGIPSVTDGFIACTGSVVYPQTTVKVVNNTRTMSHTVTMSRGTLH